MSDNIIVWSELSAKERQAIFDKHRKWWNKEAGGQRADLQGAYLQGAYLQGAYLQGAYLQGADLRGAYLQRAYLQRAYLQGAYLQGAYLQGAYLQGADLRGAYLQRAYLQGAYLQGAYLQGAYLQRADGQKIKIQGVYQCGPQGSRGDYLVAILCDDKKIYFSTGCVANMEQKEFLKRVTDTHNGNEHSKAYKAAVAHCVKMLKIQGEHK